MKGKTSISWVGRRLPEAKELLTKAASSGVQVMDLTAVPRITIAQNGETTECRQSGESRRASGIRQRGATSCVLGHVGMVGPGHWIGKPAKKTSRIGSPGRFPDLVEGGRSRPDQFRSSVIVGVHVQ